MNRINPSSSAYSVVKFFQASWRVVTEIDPKDAPAAPRECAKIPERLGLFQNAERVRLSGNRKVGHIIRDDLKEHSRVRTTLV
jgi:hypothetical protein